MRTILIAEPNSDFAEALARPLIADGYRVATCPGPWPPALRCIRCDIGYCPLTEGAHLLIYSPNLIGYGDGGEQHLLALDTGKAHPDTPLLLAWAGETEPDSLPDILAAVPNAQPAQRDPWALLAQVAALIGPSIDSTVVHPAEAAPPSR